MSQNDTQQPLVFNWHLLEPCNYHCEYCYAAWQKSELPEIYKDLDLSKELLREITSLAQKETMPVRLSFAGGEPLLDKHIGWKIKHARHLGLDVSIITNASVRFRETVPKHAQDLSWLGVSMDSNDATTNSRTGRHKGKRVSGVDGKMIVSDSRLPDYDKTTDILHYARELNPDIRIKINTVVNQYNWNEDLSDLIERIGPDKWKVLRVLPATKKSSQVTISDEQYATFRKRHEGIRCAVFEDNDDMLNSYLMIDPYGRFFYNGKEGAAYEYSECILDVGIEKAMGQINFDRQAFNNRY